MMQQDTLPQDSKPKNYLGSTLLFIGIFTTVTVAAILILLTAPISFDLAYKISVKWCASVLWLSKVCCGLDYKVSGLENIRNIPTAIVLSNHQSAWETLALRYILPRQTVLLKRSLQWFPLWGWALMPLKAIAIDRSQQRSALRLLLEKGSARLQEGLWVIVYPEGTRSVPGTVNKFSGGGAMLAQKTGYPVIPVAHNAGRYWPRYSFLKYPGTIEVKIGPVIETQDRKANDINAEAEAWIVEAVKNMA